MKRLTECLLVFQKLAKIDPSFEVAKEPTGCSLYTTREKLQSAMSIY
jgi:hypothetical protein